MIFSNGAEWGKENRTWADGGDRLNVAYSASEHLSDSLPEAVLTEKNSFCAIFQTLELLSLSVKMPKHRLHLDAWQALWPHRTRWLGCRRGAETTMAESRGSHCQDRPQELPRPCWAQGDSRSLSISADQIPATQPCAHHPKAAGFDPFRMSALEKASAGKHWLRVIAVNVTGGKSLF